MDEIQLKNACLELMASAGAVYLTTHGEDGYPRSRAMLNLRNARQYPHLAPQFAERRQDFMILFTTNTSSRKIRQVIANPCASAYYCDPASFHGVMFAGNIEVVTDQAFKQALWSELWECYYPAGINDPDYTILRMYPSFAEGWWTPLRFTFKIKDG
jgi:general stress protein 26